VGFINVKVGAQHASVISSPLLFNGGRGCGVELGHPRLHWAGCFSQLVFFLLAVLVR
jgi:hypothetical protein